jgi:single-strand DNA-binding protein
MSYSKVILIGNLGKEPNLRSTPSGKSVTDFSMATSERYKDRSGAQQEKTTWWRVTVWGATAENAAKYLAKGRKVYVEGTPTLEEYTDRDGKVHHYLAVRANVLKYLGSNSSAVSPAPADRPAQGTQHKQQPTQQSLNLDDFMDDNDAPF